MTCIVAIAEGGNVVIGGDSAGIDGRELRIRADAKVFRKGAYAVGFTTSFRMGQILRYEAELPEPLDSADANEMERFCVTKLIPAIRQAFSEHGFAKTARFTLPSKPGVSEEGQECGGTFLVGIAGQIFEIHNDFQLGRPAATYSAVGVGAAVALGALHGLEKVQGLALRERALYALEAAESYCAGVRGPFQLVESTPAS